MIAQVAAVRAHQRRAGLVLQLVHVLVRPVLRHLEQELARERVAVGVQAVGRQADQHVADLDRLAGDDLGAVDAADDEAGQVVLAVGVEAGHLRRLAADQRAAVGAAGFGQAAHHRLHRLGVLLAQLAGREVVEEEQRRRALHRDVVHAVVDQVRADRVVNAQLKRDLQLRAHAVGARRPAPAAETSRGRAQTGRRSRRSRDSTCLLKVLRASILMRCLARSPEEMSTPASA